MNIFLDLLIILFLSKINKYYSWYSIVKLLRPYCYLLSSMWTSYSVLNQILFMKQKLLSMMDAEVNIIHPRQQELVAAFAT